MNRHSPALPFLLGQLSMVVAVWVGRAAVGAIYGRAVRVL